MEVSLIADSNITKRALAQALKGLLETQPFEKISVAEICEACEMNRKSFYYHFKDKYDLVEWIFDSEFVAVVSRTDMTDRWTFLNNLCQYFYRERSFYTKMLEVTGQNSFRRYFRDYLLEVLPPFVATHFEANRPEDDIMEFYMSYLSDSVLLAIFRWLTGGAKMPPDQFVGLLKGLSDTIVAKAKELP